MNLTRLYYVAFFIVLIISAFSFIDFSVTALLLIAAGVVLCRSIFESKKWRNYSLSILMLTYLAWLFVVALSSPIPNASMVTLAILVGLPVVYLSASNLSNYNEIWKVLRVVFFVLGVMLAVWAIWQVVNNIGYGHAVGPLLDRNAFAALMNLLWFPTAFLSISSFYHSKRVLAILFAIGLFLISVALFATTSRGGVATWLLLLPVLLWAIYKLTKSKLLVAIIPMIALAAYFSSSSLLHNSVADRTFNLAQDASTSARLQMWRSTVQIAFDHPLVGTGWGTFGYIYPAYRLPTESISSGFFSHNDYLQFAAEGGIPALLILSGILLVLLLQLWRGIKGRIEVAGFESVALILGVLALFIHATVNFIFYFAFLNIIAGFYLARVAQLTESTQVVNISSFDNIRPSVKRLLSGTIVLIISAPFALHIFTQICFVGSMPGMKVINLVAQKVSAFDVARLITAIRPAEGMAQEYVMQTFESYLSGDGNLNGSTLAYKRALLAEAIERFDSIRAREANNPRVGVREVKILMTHHATYGTDQAYAKIKQILNANLKADPYHANSMIALSRLQVAEGNKPQAFKTLEYAIDHILTRRDEQLIAVESLRQQAPQPIKELDEIEEKLHQIHSDSETGVASGVDAGFYEGIELRLNAITKQIQQSLK